MTLYFSIEYRTEWGQSVEVELCFLASGGKTHRQRIPLETDDGLLWKGLAHLRSRGEQFRYAYIVTSSRQATGDAEGGDACLRREWDVVPRLFPADDRRTYFFPDRWRDAPEASYRYTDAFLTASGGGNVPAARMALFPRTLLFRLLAPSLSEDEGISLVGDQPALGLWDTARALPMTRSWGGEWLLSISADGLRLPFQYKYIKTSRPSSPGQSGKVVWEEGPNRQSPESLCNLRSPDTRGAEGLGGRASGPADRWTVAFTDGEIRLEVPHWKAAGLVVPLFSLRTEGSQGVGDLGDLMEMTSWAASVGMHAIQLLPIYDTTQNRTPADSYPYNAISVHALHPIYADLRRLPLTNGNALDSFRKRWRKLNALPALDYVEVIKMKEEYLHLYYEENALRTAHKGGRKGRQDTTPPGEDGEGLSSWEAWGRSVDWLLPYCVFCHLRDTYGTPRFLTWKTLSAYKQDTVRKYAERHRTQVGYHAFVQYILHRQLSEAAEHARNLHLFLKGDLPIGISPCSVEAWREPHLFNMDMAAGAPPDDFSPTGQNWGFPTYNWERMAADGYLWWRQRLAGMAQYFGAYRIDHILGFFRIWSIPKGSPDALPGHFSPALPMSREEVEAYGMHLREELFVEYPHGLYHPRIGVIGEEAWRRLPKNEQDAFIRLYEDFFFHRHNDFWAAQAMKKLPALVGATRMLVCGEDLGMVPACVGPVMRQLGILSLEIQTMPKAYGVPFAQLHGNPYRSVDTIFTHDMPTLRLWWREDTRRTQLYYNNVLGHDGQAPSEPSGLLCEEIIARHLESPSMLCLISLQDWLSMDEALRNPDTEAERINVPANPKNYWRYRMHLPISRLREAKAFSERLLTLIARSGRHGPRK